MAGIYGKGVFRFTGSSTWSIARSRFTPIRARAVMVPRFSRLAKRFWSSLTESSGAGSLWPNHASEGQITLGLSRRQCLQGSSRNMDARTQLRTRPSTIATVFDRHSHCTDADQRWQSRNWS